MKWHLDQITGISSLSKRFGGIEDEDLLVLLSRLKELEDAYSYLYRPLVILLVRSRSVASLSASLLIPSQAGCIRR